MREFELIDRIAARAGEGGCAPASPGNAVRGRRDDVVVGMGDDAALLSVSPGMQLVASTDTLVCGVHYPADTTPADLGWKALAVNLSDLAAMGAVPRWALLQLTLPRLQQAWVDGFLEGWCALAASSGIALVGGDSTCGPETIGVTVLGEVPSGAALLRSGAVAGDRVWVSGTLGDAAAALRLAGVAAGAPKAHPTEGGGDVPPQAHGLHAGDPASPEHRVRLGRTHAAPDVLAALRLRLDRPTPRLALGRALRGVATACIDLSDGLLADLGHLAKASGVAAELQLDALPASGTLASVLPAVERWPLQLAGGDDYELCFTAPTSRDSELQALAAASGVGLTAVGRLVVGSGVRVLHADGREYDVPQRGYQHFT